MEQAPMEEDHRQRANLFGLAAVIVIVFLGIWVVVLYRHSSARLDCFAAGHRNCEPVDISPSH